MTEVAMVLAAGAATGPPWVQIVLSIVGVLGGAGGVAAIATVLLQRRKFRADAADVITDTALTLVEPLKARVRELETETTEARRHVAAANRELGDLRESLQDATAMMRRWRSAILAPDTSLEQLRVMVTSDPGGINGRSH